MPKISLADTGAIACGSVSAVGDNDSRIFEEIGGVFTLERERCILGRT